MYDFANQLPEDDEEAIRQLQIFLINECEMRFGKRDNSKVIYLPIFRKNGPPCLMHSPNMDGAYAVLSNNSRRYWPTALYELAHETVHLLNPIVGNTNFLEEGFAVAFAVEMSQLHTNHPMEPDDGFYLEAWNLILELDDDKYSAAKKIRKTINSLGVVTPKVLKDLFPTVNGATIDKLCSKCNVTY